MRVSTLCRYPVESMLGERIDEAAVGARVVSGGVVRVGDTLTVR